MAHSHSSHCRVHRHAFCANTRPPGTEDDNNLEPLLAVEGKLSGGLGSGGLIPRRRPAEEVKSFLLFAALCFHSVMEGLGLGSANDAELFLPILVAILAHKGLAAFALGCSLAQSRLPEWKFWTFVLIFSAGSPFGCLVGALIGQGDHCPHASGVCIALASGTFLQVSTMELLPRAFAEENHKVIGAFGLTLGFAAMSFLAIWC